MDEDRICPDCKRQKARSLADALKGYCPKWWAVQDPDAAHDCDVRKSDVPTGQIPSAKNLAPFPPFSWRIVPQTQNTCLELTFNSPNLAVSALSQLQELIRTPVKAVAADTNEECETASQAHTRTKD